MAQRKVAVVQPSLALGGGTEAVTAWTMQALQDHCEVSLITSSKVDLEGLDHFYGTQLNRGQCSIVNPTLAHVFGQTDRFSMLKDHLIMRYCKTVQEEYDLFISVGRGMDLGSRCIQYFSLAPDSTLIKVLSGNRTVPIWYRIFKRSFMRGCEKLSGYSESKMLQNTTLVTSRWAGEVVKSVYAFSECRVVYPPVSTSPSKAKWISRDPVFLCISRIVPEKRIAEAIQVLKRVREKGFSVSLIIVGRQDNGHYSQLIKQLARENTWVTLIGPMLRDELQQLMDRCKYGINAAPDEPFGVAIAEMVKAGCIVFVPNGGGQTEIVDSPLLIYDHIEDGIDKISRVLGDESIQATLLKSLAQQGENFSTGVFCQSIRRVVDEFFENRRQAP